jgi:hypothetical protein
MSTTAPSKLLVALTLLSLAGNLLLLLIPGPTVGADAGRAAPEAERAPEPAGVPPARKQRPPKIPTFERAAVCAARVEALIDKQKEWTALMERTLPLTDQFAAQPPAPQWADMLYAKLPDIPDKQLVQIECRRDICKLSRRTGVDGGSVDLVNLTNHLSAQGLLGSERARSLGRYEMFRVLTEPPQQGPARTH